MRSSEPAKADPEASGIEKKSIAAFGIENFERSIEDCFSIEPFSVQQEGTVNRNTGNDLFDRDRKFQARIVNFKPGLKFRSGLNFFDRLWGEDVIRRSSEKLEKAVTVDLGHAAARKVWTRFALGCRPKVRGRFAFPGARSPRI